jgi:acyl carrier protein
VREKLARVASAAHSRRNGDAVQQHDSADGESAADKTRLNEVAESYVRGDQIDWPDFYGSHCFSRVPLPTYPFQRQRYWLDNPSEPIAAEPAAASPSNGHHPRTTSSQKTNGFALRSSAVPLNGNGQSANHAGSEHLQSVLEDSIVRVLELPAMNSISPDQDLYDLGMDSITALEMLFAAEKSLGFPLRQPGIARSRTINQFIECIRSGAPSHAAPQIR